MNPYHIYRAAAIGNMRRNGEKMPWEQKKEGAELIHLSGPMVAGTGQQCTRCKLVLVRHPETPVAEGHRIYIDGRVTDYNTRPLVDISDSEGMLPDEERFFSRLPDCQP